MRSYPSCLASHPIFLESIISPPTTSCTASFWTGTTTQEPINDSTFKPPNELAKRSPAHHKKKTTIKITNTCFLTIFPTRIKDPQYNKIPQKNNPISKKYSTLKYKKIPLFRGKRFIIGELIIMRSPKCKDISSGTNPDAIPNSRKER